MSILVAYKPSAEGDVVLEAAMAEARLRKAKLVIAHYVRRDREQLGESLAHPMESPGKERSRDVTGQDLERLRKEMEDLRGNLDQQGYDCEAILLTEGEGHADQILRLAARGQVGLIVVGIRRRSRVGKALLGSDAQDILLGAPCPVLAVKSD